MRPLRLRRGDAGDTLIELLFAIVILSLSVTALLGALTTAIAASGEHQSLAREDALLRSYAQTAASQIEFQTSSSTPFTECAQPSDYPVIVSNIPTGYTVSINLITYWNGTSFQDTNKTGCSSQDMTGVQLVTLSATGPGARQTLSFVVRNPAYAASEHVTHP